jgi:hypothetical protein
MFYMVLRTIFLRARDLEQACRELKLDITILLLIQQTRYLRNRSPVLKAGHLHLAWNYARDPKHRLRFVDMLRVLPETFQAILGVIEGHDVFRTKSRRPQAPVQLQLAVVLYRMGRYGNGASVNDIARVAGVSEGTVEVFTARCFTALMSHHDEYVRELSEHEKEAEKTWIEEHVGCPGWREGWLMYDGTIIPLYQKPALDGDAYFTRKGNYGLNAQVCLCSSFLELN